MIPGVAPPKVSLAPPKNIYEVLNSKRNEMVKSRVNYRCRGSLLSCRFIDPVGMLPYSVASPAIASEL